MKTEEKTMTLITRKQAASCTDSELQSLLSKLFNELASGRLDAVQQRVHLTSARIIGAEFTSRRKR
jgi:hypothetical protein